MQAAWIFLVAQRLAYIACGPPRNALLWKSWASLEVVVSHVGLGARSKVGFLLELSRYSLYLKSQLVQMRGEGDRWRPC